MRRLKHKIIVGITMGDPAGIGPAIILKGITKLKGLADFVVIGDKWVFDQVSGVRCQVSGVKFIDLHNVTHKNFKFGKIKAEYGRASVEYLDKALELIKNNQIDCLVTCPVSKKAVSLGGFDKFLGHTEYLAARTNIKYFAMMLLNKKLKISLVTRHIPLKDVPSKLDSDKIYKTILLTYRSLKELFLIKNPRIAVCGLNPHASDNGLLGQEENNIIRPAIVRLKRIIRNIDGPFPADVAVLKTAQEKYDCVIAMYHDQALIPLKISGAYTGVNLTLGLRFIRTSPLHGTAFDIAGKFNLANPTSLIEAIRLAVRCTLNQKKD
ncbi:MAG: 4-hydroxythreonine-4-phosphate dehydrogenase PdxA [Candidatus Omnitrophica bacterium CG23_combo_of_CG06-09_8_20_14_all_40_11]|nr:MAG: 4-hydroxythreonine-4-phosphate dehydrogenase PdxA [Candidatus Omnitrophica bacterium CG23_combo_of_CG06-09_8_20_14_all_40_11]